MNLEQRTALTGIGFVTPTVIVIALILMAVLGFFTPSDSKD